MNWLFDPRIFNVAIIVLFVAATVRWAFAGDFMQAMYWLGATVLNVAVFGMAK